MGSAIHPNEIKRFEVTEVYSHPDAKVDIVLVHGLNGHPQNTWTAKNGVFWPSQLLPVSLKQFQARILVYGYNADVYTFGSNKGGPSSDMIHQHAQTLLTNLALERKSEDVEEHPIIWVAHSLGGILVKRALELSNDLQGSSDGHLRSIYVSTYGIIFLGTPHTGSDVAKWGVILQGMVDAMIPKKLLESHSQLVKTLKNNNETLQNINLKFLDIYPHRLKVCMVHESHPTDLKGSKALIVDQASAAPMLPDVQYFGIEATHSGMCKFESKNAPGYTNVSVTLRSWAQECPPIIQRNWEDERLSRKQKIDYEISKLRGPSESVTPQPRTSAPNSPDPGSLVSSTIIVNPVANIPPESPEPEAAYFIKPSGFRPNSLFVGREEQLAQMHKMLFDPKRRAEGTSAVLIQSLPGGGKTHLARQYVYEHKDDFPGGIFWLRAKSSAELASGFWDIARKVALKHSIDSDMGERDSEQFIRMVRKWFNHRQHWLLVLDGIHFGDHIFLRKFIPDNKNTGLIYTSTERSVIGDHHFMNPQIIKLPLLSAREAQRLLLLELGRREPFHRDDLRYANELVQSMGFLPVVIHAVSQRLKATDEPLSRFARSYSSEPRLRGLGTYLAVVEQLKQLGAVEALNLVHILCFFSQVIPVEMISLGLKALDVSVKAFEGVTGNSLNNTFKILNTFALIERNEHDYPVHSSQSSHGSRELLADNVDVIRLHGVVQGFFVDTLAADGSLPIWLDRAVGVFCCSYDHANERITRKTHAGLVEDYRLYEIHGLKLKEHLTNHLKKHLEINQKIVLNEALNELEQRLQLIKTEIERRTPESSDVIAGGRSEVLQTSIFDRTSSSSDTGPETPGWDKTLSAVSTWGLEPDKGQLESPESISHAEYKRRIELVHRSQFPMPMPEDPGYDSDRETSIAMTPQLSQGTVRQNPDNPGEWEEVKPRRPRGRPEALPLHRTVKNLERTRYRDTAGAYRAMNAIDPRVSTENAQGYLQRSSSRAQSRGRITGRSGAEVSLAHITAQSPPPARGGGTIQDRRRSSVRGDRMTTGKPSYAAAVADATRDTISSFKELIRPSTEPQISSSESTSTLDRPRSSAMESLQRFPIEVIAPTPASPRTPIPPYPSSPYLYPSSDNGIYDMPGNYSQENLPLGHGPYPSSDYPRLEGLPPTEYIKTTSSSPLAIPSPNFAASHSFTGSLPASHSNLSDAADFLSLSSPNIKLQREASNTTYIPGRPELSNQQGGYTSQPMSRDPSGQSNKTVHSTGQIERRRRPSVAETEPVPLLPAFSPRIPPTSYQVYERMRERDLLRGEMEEGDLEELRRERERRVLKKKSPRLEFARAALIERLDEWGGEKKENNNSPPQKQLRPFNPTAPSFSPSPSNYTYSPALPPAPAPSMLSNPSPMQNIYSSTPSTIHSSPYPATSPYPPHHNTPLSYTQSTSYLQSPYPAFPQSQSQFQNHSTTSSPPQPHNTPSSFQTPSSNQGEPMERTGSGGVKIGSNLISFGDFPEKVDAVKARERVVKSWGEREREVERRRREREEEKRRARGGEDGRERREGRGVGLGLGLEGI